jgi:tRNA dimethylallyltransferase
MRSFMSLREINSNLKKLLCVITGPTACAKTDVTIRLAQHYNTHILSADSRQFYRQLVIGAATPNAEELSMAPHHFIGHLSVDESYNVYKFEQEALALCNLLFETHQVVFLTGGSGLYIDALTKGIDLLPDPDPELRESLNSIYENEGLAPLQEKLKELDPDYFEQVDQSNPVRLIRAIEVCVLTGEKYSHLRNQDHDKRPFEVLKIVLDRPKEELHQRIHLRTDIMIKEGLIDEVRALMPYRTLNALNTVGYKEIFQYLDGNITLDQAIEDIKTNTRRYAKRQLTWFRRDPEYHWINANNLEEIQSLIDSNLADSL